jgi:hypothetical protein
LRSLYGTLCNDSSSANLTVGDTLLADSVRVICALRPWPFLDRETDRTLATVASQSVYQIPAGFRKLSSLYVTVGTTVYQPFFVDSDEQWNTILASNLGDDDAPQFWTRKGDTVILQPASATADNTITFRGSQSPRDLSIADYTTGSVVSVANGGVAVIGTETTWAASMAGRFIRITESDTANKGDGFWYEISSVTDATHLTLVKPYNGTAIAAGTAAYAIGQMSPIPEAHDIAPVYRSVALYYSKEDSGKANIFWRLYDGGVEAGLSQSHGGIIGAMMAESGSKISSPYSPPLDLNPIDPNDPPRSLATGL